MTELIAPFTYQWTYDYCSGLWFIWIMFCFQYSLYNIILLVHRLGAGVKRYIHVTTRSWLRCRSVKLSDLNTCRSCIKRKYIIELGRAAALREAKQYPECVYNCHTAFLLQEFSKHLARTWSGDCGEVWRILQKTWKSRFFTCGLRWSQWECVAFHT